MEDMKPDCPVAITRPEIVCGEAETLSALAAEGATVHIRKPGADREAVEGLLRELRSSGADMDRFTLHYDEPLARRYGLGGVHLGGEDIRTGAGAGLRRSCSTHGWDEAGRFAASCDYLFLSPVFDSMSKKGYRGAIDPDDARQWLAGIAGRVVALGGIGAGNIARVREAGFGGAAVLGALWEGDPDLDETVARYRALRRKWLAAGGRLQFISDGDLSVAEEFLRGGGRWVQLRMKETPPEQIVLRGRQMLALCRRYRALLIVNDDPRLAAAIGADGVHLGQGDMPPAEARRIVGDRAIVGSTANTFAQIAARTDGHTDYIGLGPFRFTTTKKNLSPVLGAEGYRTILSRMRAEGIWLPVVAIGGIGEADAASVMETGVTGIAASGAIAGAADAARATARFLSRIDGTERKTAEQEGIVLKQR